MVQQRFNGQHMSDKNIQVMIWLFQTIAIETSVHWNWLANIPDDS